LSDRPLRILIANEKIERLAILTRLVQKLGHDVVARALSASDVAGCATRERVDVALVGLGDSSEHALELVSEIVTDAHCPVIAVLSEENTLWVSEAARRGVFAYVIAGNLPALRSTIEIVIARFKERRKLEKAVQTLNLDARHEVEISRARLQRMAHLHDEVVQGLVTAKLAHEMGRGQDSYSAVRETLDRARAIVSRSMAELKRQGVEPDQAIAVVTPSRSNG
jgi:AmiR/NasT family two-component response regulator